MKSGIWSTDNVLLPVGREVQNETHASQKKRKGQEDAEKAWGPGMPTGRSGQASEAPPMGGRQKKEVPHRPDSGSIDSPQTKNTRRAMGPIDNAKNHSGGQHFNWEKRIRLEMLDRTLYPDKRKPNMAELARHLGK